MPKGRKTKEIKELRSIAGKSQAWLAQQVGVKTNTVARWERGELPISPARLQQVQAALTSGDSTAVRSDERNLPEIASRDPMVKDIARALDGHLDPHVFERSMVDLLRGEFPTFALVMGGADGGSDGATATHGAASPVQLICTTSKRPLDNFRKSLARLRKTRPHVRSVIFTQSRALTPVQRENLRKRAHDAGYELIQSYGRDDLALRIRHRPDIALDLLDVSGVPPALSASPSGKQEHADDTLLMGREKDYRWLTQQVGDCLLVAPPQMGKTALLQALANQGEGLFLDTTDEARVAHDVRLMEPLCIMVPDAHEDYCVRSEPRIQMLQRVRELTGCPFRIVATSWPGDDEHSVVQQKMGLTSVSVRHLQALKADVVAELVRTMAGGRFPDDWVRGIRRQAYGKPGVARYLTKICLGGDYGKALTGSALQTLQAQGIKGRELDILAALALGGEDGLETDVLFAVMSVFGVDPSDLHDLVPTALSRGLLEKTEPRGLTLAQIAEGVEAPSAPKHAVRPYDFRCAVVLKAWGAWQVSGVLDSIMEQFKPGTQSSKTAIRTLIGAAYRGAHLPRLAGWVEQQQDAELVVEYAYVNGDAAAWAGKTYPALMGRLAGALLEQAPEVAVGRLLDHLTDQGEHGRREDCVDLRPAEGTALHHVRQWTSGGEPNHHQVLLEQQVNRRKQLVDDVAEWMGRQRGDNTEVPLPAIACMCLSMIPAFEFEGADPGRGKTYTIYRGLLPKEHLLAVARLWPNVMSVMRVHPPVRIQSWEALFSLVLDWIAPHRRGAQKPTDERAELLRSTAESMLHDLATLATPLRGVQLKLQRTAETIGVDLSESCRVDDDFRILHPSFPLKRTEEWGALIEKAQGKARELGELWGRQSAENLVEMMLVTLQDSTILRRTGHVEDLMPFFCSGVLKTFGAEKGADATIRMIDCGISQVYVSPFMHTCAKCLPDGWKAALRKCLQTEGYEYSAIESIMVNKAAERVLGDMAFAVLFQSPSASEWGHSLSLRKQLPPHRVLAAMRMGAVDGPGESSKHKRRFALNVAVGHWYARNKEHAGISDDMLPSWRVAIAQSAHADGLSIDHDMYWVGEILSKDGELALLWMREALVSAQSGTGGICLEDIALKAVGAMNKQQRQSLLKAAAEIGVNPISQFFASAWAPACVGDDADLYEMMLSCESLQAAHGHPLSGEFTPAWKRKALVALKHYEVGWVVFWGRADRERLGWIGKRSDDLVRVGKKFESLLHHPKRPLRKIGERGVASLQEEIMQVRRQEENERNTGLLDPE